MVLQQFDDVLRGYHCLRIDALHKPFDPHLHQAISQQPSQEYPAQHGGVCGPTRLSIVRPRRAAQPGDCFDR